MKTGRKTFLSYSWSGRIIIETKYLLCVLLKDRSQDPGLVFGVKIVQAVVQFNQSSNLCLCTNNSHQPNNKLRLVSMTALA